MKKLLLASLAIVAFAGVAQAESKVCVRPYASLKGTYSRLDMAGTVTQNADKFRTAKTDWVWGGAAAVGLKMCAFRTELEYNQTFSTARDTRKNGLGLTRGKQSYRSYMLNGYFDLPTGTDVHPYVGAGIGLARVKNRLADLGADAVTKHRETNVAYQLMAGVGYNMTRNWTLDIGYRWVDNGRSTWHNGTDHVKFDSAEHQFTAGIRYTF